MTIGSTSKLVNLVRKWFWASECLGDVVYLRQSTDPGQDRALASNLEEPHLLENYFFPEDLKAQIEAFIDYYNHQRCHESLNNLTPANVQFGRGQAVVINRERIKQKTIENQRLQLLKSAA